MWDTSDGTQNTYPLLQLIMQGKIIGNRVLGEIKTSWLKNLRQWFEKTPVERFRAVVNGYYSGDDRQRSLGEYGTRKKKNTAKSNCKIVVCFEKVLT